MEKLEFRYVWEWPVRIIHWVNFLAILGLSVTGIYIGWGKSLAHNPSQYMMGWMRFVHFVARICLYYQRGGPDLLGLCREQIRQLACFYPLAFQRWPQEHEGDLPLLHLFQE